MAGYRAKAPWVSTLDRVTGDLQGPNQDGTGYRAKERPARAPDGVQKRVQL